MNSNRPKPKYGYLNEQVPVYLKCMHLTKKEIELVARNERQKEIVQSYFLEGKSIREIAREQYDEFIPSRSTEREIKINIINFMKKASTWGVKNE